MHTNGIVGSFSLDVIPEVIKQAYRQYLIDEALSILGDLDDVASHFTLASLGQNNCISSIARTINHAEEHISNDKARLLGHILKEHPSLKTPVSRPTNKPPLLKII